MADLYTTGTTKLSICCSFSSNASHFTSDLRQQPSHPHLRRYLQVLPRHFLVHKEHHKAGAAALPHPMSCCSSCTLRACRLGRPHAALAHAGRNHAPHRAVQVRERCTTNLSMCTAFGLEFNCVNRHQRGGKAAVGICNANLRMKLACAGELEERKGAARGHVQGEGW